MRRIISRELRQAAEALVALDESLSLEDVQELNSRAPELVKIVKKNMDEDSDPFKNLSEGDKRLLLAFVVYKRQNITTEDTDRPNNEDAARILHGKVYSLEGTEKEKEKASEDLEEDLKKQLNKAGLEIK